MLPLTAISDAVAAHGDQKEIVNAKSEFAKADSELTTTRPDRYESAIDHYCEAWKHALKAIGKG